MIDKLTGAEVPMLPCPACGERPVSLLDAFTRCTRCIMAGNFADSDRLMAFIRAAHEYKALRSKKRAETHGH
jgi:hypothetical protein